MSRPKNARVTPPKNKHPEPGIRWLDARGCWMVDVSLEGKRHTKTFTILTLARDWKRQTQTAPLVATVSSMTLRDWVTRWLADLEHDSTRDKVNGLSPRTIEGYKEKLHRYAVPHLGDQLLTKLEPLMLSDWIKTIQRLHTINAAYEAHRRLKGCLSAAVRFQLIPSNPLNGLRPPKGAKSEKSNAHDTSRWSDKEATKVLKTLDADSRSPIRYLMKVWLATGLRKQEIFGLRWQDVNFDQQCLTIRHTCTEVDGKMQLRLKTKTGRERQVTFDSYAFKALKAQQEKNLEFQAARASEWSELDLVFPNERGQPFSMTLFSKWFKRLCEAAEVSRIRPYDIRSTHGSALYFNTDMDEKTAADRMGHSVRTYLETYVRPLEAERRSTLVKTQSLFAPQTKRKQNPKANKTPSSG
jgi:integrase